jgi:hypothetical protein
VAEVAGGKQEWRIRDIVGKEVVDGEEHHLVKWTATLVREYDSRKAKGFVDKSEAGIRAQYRQMGKDTFSLRRRQANKHLRELTQHARRNKNTTLLKLGQHIKIDDISVRGKEFPFAHCPGTALCSSIWKLPSLASSLRSNRLRPHIEGRT